MKTMRKTAFCFLLACLMAGGYARAQGSDTAGIPEDVFYLMPSFGEGSVYFSDKSPAHGRLNICAVKASPKPSAATIAIIPTGETTLILSICSWVTVLLFLYRSSRSPLASWNSMNENIATITAKTATR